MGRRSKRVLCTEIHIYQETSVVGGRDEREGLVKQFLSEYPDIIDDARVQFGSTFNESDFPHPNG